MATDAACRATACERAVYANGYCRSHYNRWYNHGGNVEWTPPPKPGRDPDGPLYESGAVRAEYGCTVTFENESGHTFVMHRTGPPTAVLDALCDVALGCDPTFRLVAYSTPASIASDLRGERVQIASGRAHIRPQTPEAQMLARIGRREMLHPRLRSAA
jgi:hypothetical protein